MYFERLFFEHESGSEQRKRGFRLESGERQLVVGDKFESAGNAALQRRSEYQSERF
jgi:hypothetical protein